jgi:hypothetical protein
MNEEEYKRSFVDNGIRTTPKQRKIKKLAGLTGKPESYWSKITSKQAGAILSIKASKRLEADLLRFS